MRSRLLCAVGCFFLAVLLLFFAVPLTAKQMYPKIEVVRTTKSIEHGAMFDADDLEVVRMGAYPLSDTAVTDIYDVIGRYAAVDIVSGDILLTEKVSQVPFQDGEAMSLLPEGYETAVAMVQIMEGSEVTALQTGDIIKMNGYDDGLIDIPALNFVRVITAMEPDAEGVIWITVSANQRQSTFLEKHRKDVFHVSVMVRENEELAEKLLQQQSAYFEEEP